MKIYDKFGTEQPQAWLTANFGPVTVDDPSPKPASYYQVAELRENDDLPTGMTAKQQDALGKFQPAAPSAIISLVLDAAGKPVPGETLVFWWPDAPSLPGSGWHEHGVTGQTKDSGLVDFCMGPGAYYYPPNKGPHDLWVAGAGRSQLLTGLGMIGGTNHRHLDVVWRLVTNQEPPIDPPDVPGAASALCQARAALQDADRAVLKAKALVDKALAALRARCVDPASGSSQP